MKRVFDILLASLTATLLLLPIIAIAVLVRITSDGPAIYWSKRIGKYGRLFMMPKFRTMKINTPAVATHLMTDADSHMTPIGRILRSTSLDEVPQVWSILIGQMSFVGPRPALFNQHDLIELRSKAGLDCLTPGLTGWAQVNGRDEISVTDKVKLDLEYLQKKSMRLDLKILVITVVKVFRREEILH